IRDANPLLPVSSYSATVDWGDGSSGLAMVVGNSGTFLVRGGHAYQSTGDYSIVVHVHDDAGRSTSASSVAHVGLVQAGQQARFYLDGFTTTAPLGGLSAAIGWGDGSTEAGTITGSSGSFSVGGSHTYAAEGYYLVQVAVSTPSGSIITAQDTVRVVRDPII